MYDMSKSSTIKEYKDTMMNVMKLFVDCDDRLISQAIDYSINKRYQKNMCKVDNSYTHQVNQMSLLALADYINDRQPIVTAHGTMFKKHADCPNPMGIVIQQFLDQRSKDKKMMFKFPKGSEDFEKYNLLQSLDKR